MCGIAGVLSFGDFPVARQRLVKLSKSLEHRGPNGVGYATWSENTGLNVSSDIDSLEVGKVGLVHRRLSIIDLSDAASQPFVSPDGKVVVVFNGEIYNYIELRDQLLKRGYNFVSQSDTEVLVSAYREWGMGMLPKLIGMFSFAVLDLKIQKLFCARDFFGIKPLYFSNNSKFFAFASEIKSLFTMPEVGRSANNQLVYDYLLNGRQEGVDSSFFSEIKQLPPAHYLELSLGHQVEPVITRYWNVTVDKTINIDRNEAAEQLRTLFNDSVRMHMRSDVPIAANLSGGIDSSSIVAAMRHNEAVKDIHTISFISDYERISEEQWIDIVNEEKSCIAHKVKPDSSDLVSSLEELVNIQEEPFGSTSPFAQMQVFQQIKKLGMRVVLDGQGADEFLGGYRSYIFARFQSLLAAKQPIKLMRYAYHAGMLPDIVGGSSLLTKARKAGMKFLESWSNSSRQLESSTAQKMQLPSANWLKQEYFESKGVCSTLQFRVEGPEFLREQLLLTFVQSSLPHLLRVADRNSMAASVESRLPFLTPQIAEFIFSLPEDFLIDDTAETKSIFRKAMAGQTPKAILARRDKIGFSTPEQEWLMEIKDWYKDLLSSETAKQLPLIDTNQMLIEFQGMLDGKFAFDWRFWRWANLIMWAKQYQVRF